ncbi:MAG TPA: hypothetical protein VG276_10250 [Actinomycetes bacterium]|nr:hypothetical protein [Actinomycetes bacterium]
MLDHSAREVRKHDGHRELSLRCGGPGPPQSARFAEQPPHHADHEAEQKWAETAPRSAAGMMWSAVPITSQDGIVFQAGTPDWSNSALVASGRWVAASTAPSRAGRPLAKHPGNTRCLM